MPFDDVSRNLMLDHIATYIEKAQLYGDISGEVYDQPIPDHVSGEQLVSVAWESAVSGELSMSGELSFEVPGGWTVTDVYLYNNDGSTRHGYYPIAEESQETYTNDGLFNLDEITLKISNIT